MSYTIMDSLPFPRVLSSASTDHLRFLLPRVLRLVCAGSDMVRFWNAMAAEGWVSQHPSTSMAPGSLDDDERRQLQAEIGAYVAREVYVLTRDEIDYVLDTLPIVEKRDRKEFGEYRTKRLILEAFGGLAGSQAHVDRISHNGGTSPPRPFPQPDSADAR
jgi:hypothetical protein